MRIGKLVALLALLFVTSSAYAANSLATCPYIGSTGVTALPVIPEEGIELAALALTISFDVVAIGFMLSRAFPHLGLRQWLQNEYWEIAKSAMLIVGIYAVLIFVSSLAYSIQGTAPPTGSGLDVALNGMLYNSETYLCGVNSYLQGTWNLVGDMFLGIGFMKSLVVGYYTPIPIPLPNGGFGFSFGVEYGPFQNLMLDTGNFLVAFYQSIINDYIQFLLFPTTLTTLAQIILIQPVMAIGLTFFIPFGLVLRAFPFVRGVGGTLVAIGIGFALVYPAVLTLFNAPVTLALQQDIPLPQWQTCGIGTSGAAGCSTANTCSTFSSGISGIPVIGFVGAVTGFFCNQILKTFELLSSYGNGISFGFSVFGPISYFVNFMVTYGVYEIVQLLLFVLDLLIIYSVTDSIARSLGGSIRLELGGKLKLAT